MGSPAIPLRLDGVTIRYPNGQTAVRDLSLEVRPGEVFGLVGPNGAGKSTLLKAAAGLIRAERGTIRYGDMPNPGDAALAARYVAFMADPLGVYNDLTARQYLEFFARAFHIPAGERHARIDRAAARLGLEPWLGHEVETLSAGWQRRLALGRILLADAPIVLLDEPAAGLDVSARRELLAVVRGLASETRAVVVTSHILPELEELADRFGVIGDGAWVPVAEGQTFFTAADLKGGFGTARCRIACGDAARAVELLRPFHPSAEAIPDGVRFPAPDREGIARAVSLLSASGVSVYEVRTEGRSLSDVAAKLLKTS